MICLKFGGNDFPGVGSALSDFLKYFIVCNLIFDFILIWGRSFYLFHPIHVHLTLCISSYASCYMHLIICILLYESHNMHLPRALHPSKTLWTYYNSWAGKEGVIYKIVLRFKFYIWLGECFKVTLKICEWKNFCWCWWGAERGVTHAQTPAARTPIGTSGNLA